MKTELRPPPPQTPDERFGQLEANVAALFRLQDSLSAEVHALTDSLRQYGEKTSEALRVQAEKTGDQIRHLTQLATDAKAPKETNWIGLGGVLLSLVSVLALVGGLVLWPLAKELDELKRDYREHAHLTLHPVGATKVDAIEKAFDVRARELETRLRDFAQTDVKAAEQLALLQRALVVLEEQAKRKP